MPGNKHSGHEDSPGPPVPGAKMFPEIPGNKYFSSFGQLWIIQSPFRLKRVQLGTKILTDGCSSSEHFQELGCVVFVSCRMTLMLTSHDHWDFVNHSENFRKPEDNSVHTNTIEGFYSSDISCFVVCKSGRWFVFKRTLPRSGAYDLAR